MKLEVLHVPDCPNVGVLTDRLDTLTVDRTDVVVQHWTIYDQAEAAERGMTGSPTLLVDGVDPFAAADQPPSLSCRLYIDESGAVSGAPSLAQLRAVLADRPNRRPPRQRRRR